MHKLHDLSFIYRAESRSLRDQQEILKNILEPILWNRYREKFQSLNLDMNFLNECLVSPPYEKKTRKDIDEDWNTAVRFTFPENHPVLKGVLEVAYSRATQKAFFGDVVIDAFFFEEIKHMDQEVYLLWWHERLKAKLGKYYEKYGTVTCCDFGGKYNSHDKTIIVQVPQLSVLKEYFYVYEGCEKYAPSFGDFYCQLYTANDYAILREKQVLEFRVFRSVNNERTISDGIVPQPD